MNRPEVRKIGKYTFQLLKDFEACGVVVPAGFITDGASVPRVVWTLFNPVGELFEASIIHDYLYANAIESKKYADLKFKEVADLYRANNTWAAYLAVRVGGKGKY